MYGKVNGKQLKDSTVDLLKLDLSGSQGTFLFATGSYLGAYEVPNIPQAFITKQYADSLSSGLDPKESVYLVAVGNITPNGTSVVIDGITASLGKRVLLAGQASAVNNGIYVVSAGTWSRASDSNGDPANEVSLGNYTFVERGATFSSTGWVLYDTNATGATVSPGNDTQLWTQFNGAGNFIWGDGLTNTGNTINIDLSPNGGLTFSSTQLTLANYVAGNGLTLTNGILDVGAGTGISVAADTISIANTSVTAGTYGSASSVSQVTFNAQGQATAATSVAISIPSGQVSNFTSSVTGLVGAGTGISVSNSGGAATVSIANTGVAAGSYGAAGSVNSFSVNAQGQLTSVATQSISITSGQVSNFTASVQGLATQVIAGTGINVSSVGGFATVSIANTTVTANTYGNAATVPSVTFNAQGQAIAATAVSISITSGQVSNFTASVQGLSIASVNAGTGLTVSQVGGVATVSIANTGVAAGSYGAAGSVNSFSVNAQGQLTSVATQSISITSGQVSNFTASVQGLSIASVNASTGLTVSTVGGVATFSIANTGVTSGSYGAAGSINTFSVNAQGQLTTVATQSISITSGQVSNFTASVSGLVKAGTGITIITAGGGGATVSISNTTVTANTYGAADTVPSVTFNAQGQAIAATAVSISITSGQVNNFTSSVSGLVKAGSGINVTSGSGGATVSVSLVKGVTFSGNSLFSDAGTILTTSILPITNIATNSTVQSALSAIDSYLSNVGAQTELSIANSPTGTFLKTVNAPVNALGYTFSTASDGAPHVYINGLYVKTNSATSSSPAYFSTDGGVTGTTTVGTSSVLYLNPFVLGFKLDPTDDIVVHYLTKTF